MCVRACVCVCVCAVCVCCVYLFFRISTLRLASPGLAPIVFFFQQGLGTDLFSGKDVDSVRLGIAEISPSLWRPLLYLVSE